MSGKIRVIIAGGGTGGHLFPALAIADELRELGAHVNFIGSKFGIEAQTLPEKGETPLLLPIRGIQRDFSLVSILKNLLFPFRFISSYVKSVRFINHFRPQVVVGTGGYSSGVPLLAAIRSGIKTLIQEQNSYPGITTRKLSGKVDIICTAFDEASRYLSGDIRIYGNPIRKGLVVTEKADARRNLNIREDLPAILILGGSQGSLPLNRHFSKWYPAYIEKGFQIIWQCGETHYAGLKTSIQHDNVRLFPFIQDMGLVYSASDLVVCRSGALTISELSFCRKASVLVPFPFAAGDHQTVNARSMTEKGAAVLVSQDELNRGILERRIFSLFESPDTIPEMEKIAGMLSRPDAAEKIANAIMGLA